jgi:coenzyme F420-0:L-glutamate ligase/coenzyme F420-1:gamma-L-glutamate ligase
MPDGLAVLPVRGIGEVVPGTNLAEVIAAAAPWIRDGDVLVVTSKIVSKAEGQLIDVPESGPLREAARDEALAAETARTVARRGHTRIVQTHHGFVMASAGIDASNVERSRLVLLPKDPDASARALRSALREQAGVNVAVVISDTMGRPWRSGLTDVALGAAGLDPVRDYRGERDPYGNEMHLTQMAVIDELSGAAELVKGKFDQVPVAVVRGVLTQPPTADGPGAAALVRDAEHDLFALGTAEARAAGLAQAATLADPPGFAADPVDPAVVRRAVTSLASWVPFAVSGPDPQVTVTFPADPERAMAVGAEVHRLRCALAAVGLATTWPPGTTALTVGHPAPGRS